MHISKVSKSFNEEVSFLFNDDSAFFIRLQKAQNYAQTSVIEPVPKSEIASGRESETELPTKKEAELSNEKEIDNSIDQ